MSVMNPEALPLAKKVLEKITQEPQWFNMNHWFDKCEVVVDGRNRCGTTACLAGWAMLLSGEFKLDYYGEPILTNTGSYEENGARLLGLPIEEVRDPGGNLFYSDEYEAIDRLRELIAEAEAV